MYRSNDETSSSSSSDCDDNNNYKRNCNKQSNRRSIVRGSLYKKEALEKELNFKNISRGAISCPKNINDWDGQYLDWNKFHEYSNWQYELEKARRWTDIRHGIKVQTLDDLTYEDVFSKMKQMYGFGDEETRNPHLKLFYDGFESRLIEQLKEMVAEEANKINYLKEKNIPLINKKYDSTVRVKNAIQQEFTPEEIKTFDKTLINKTKEMKNLFLYPRNTRTNKMARKELSKAEIVSNNISMLKKKHPYGFTMTFLCDIYMKEYGEPLVINESPPSVWIPPKQIGNEKYSNIVFPMELKKAVQSVELIAWMIWHKIHLLVGRFGFVDMRRIDQLLLEQFNMTFKPEAWGFRDYYSFLQFFFSYFRQRSCYRSGIIKEVKNQLYLTVASYFVSSDCNNFPTFNKKWEKSGFQTESVSDVDCSHFDHRILQDFVQPGDTPIFAKDMISTGDVLRCATVCVRHFEEFYVQVCDQMMRFIQFEDYMGKCFEQPMFHGQNIPDYENLVCGMYFGVFCKRIPSELQKWHRVQVIKLITVLINRKNDDGIRVMVFFVDYGDFHIVKRTDLRNLPRILLMSQTVMAIPCLFRRPRDKDTDNRVAAQGTVLGDLLQQYLFDHKAQELIKFHNRWINALGESIWFVSSALIHPAKAFFITSPGVTIAQLIMQKLFIEKEQPRPECKYATKEDYWENVDNPEYVLTDIPPRLLDSWIEEETKLNLKGYTPIPISDISDPAYGDPYSSYLVYKRKYYDTDAPEQSNLAVEDEK